MKWVWVRVTQKKFGLRCRYIYGLFLEQNKFYLPPTKEEVYAIARDVCLSACLLARLLKNACMDLDEILRVDRCRDMDELMNFWARSVS